MGRPTIRIGVRFAALLTCLALGACANADGSRPRLAADAPASGFGGGYAGANTGFSNLNTRTAPF